MTRRLRLFSGGAILADAMMQVSSQTLGLRRRRRHEAVPAKIVAI
jgi:hypothetical protein